MTDNVIELGRHEVTVETVISRLYWHQNRIKNITAIVEWDNGAIQFCGNPKPVSMEALFSLLMQQKATDILFDKNEKLNEGNP